MLDKLKQKVYEANIKLWKSNLVIFTWGNVSAKTDDNKIVIKPSGVEYEKMRPEDMVITDIEGNIIEGSFRPSSDTPTHIEIYKAFPEIRGICHTHSVYATSFAQAGKNIECYGTTHADYFYGAIPCTRHLTEIEIKNNYEKNTGIVIAEEFKKKDYLAIPGCLVKSHGVFTWGKDANKAVENAIVLENLAKMNFITLELNNRTKQVNKCILDKHYYRKHGVNAYYGQEKQK